MTAREALHSSKSAEWYTPPEIIEPVRKALGGVIKLDPASNAIANEIVQARRFFTEREDGLSKTWREEWFCNPPYGIQITNRWVNHMLQQPARGIALLNATPDRNWFHKLWEFPICFLYKRIRFYETFEQYKDRFVEKWIKKHGFSPGFADIPVPSNTLLNGRLVLGPQPTHGNALVCVGSHVSIDNVREFESAVQHLGHVIIPDSYRRL